MTSDLVHKSQLQFNLHMKNLTWATVDSSPVPHITAENPTTLYWLNMQ